MAEDLKLWKRRARSYQQSCSNSLGDRIFDRVTEEHLASKVGYAIYNEPSEVDEKTKSAVYKKAEKRHIKLVCDQVKLLHPAGENIFYISYLYVVIRLRNKKNDQGIQVLFRVPKFKEGKPILDQYDFIDPKPRRYETWNDYLCKNKLPKCDMCYPVNGIYTVIDGRVDIQFGTSPACNIRTAVLSGLDVSSTVLMVGATGVTLVSLAVPIAAPFVWGATATVLASGTYETARNLYQLHDIKKHGESLGFKNPDSRGVWLSLAGSVVGMASIGTTAIAAKGMAATESALTRAGIITLRVLNVSSLAVSGIGVVDGIITLVMKRINGTLNTKDILRFTSACLFFSNILVTYKLASRLIEELALSDLTNLFNLRENTSFRAIKCVKDFTDSKTFGALLQFFQNVGSKLPPDIGTDDLKYMVFEIFSLLSKWRSGKISDGEFFKEILTIMHNIWKRYQNDIMKVVEDIKKSFGTPYWQQITPSHKSTNFEIPLQMCKIVERVDETCGISDNSYEHKHLMMLASKFARTHGNMKEQDFINRFQFFCDIFVAQFKEERENYENELDSQNATKDFVRSDFDRSYGIEGNKFKFFFDKAFDKVNHPEFLRNINELYENRPRIEETRSQLPYLKTEKSKTYTFCGPLNEKELSNDYYWDKASDLSGIKTDCKNSVITRENDLVVIQPISKHTEVADVEMANQLTELEAIVIYTTFLDNCHMGFLIVIQKWKMFKWPTNFLSRKL